MISPDAADFKRKALDLVDQAQADYEELKAVPAGGLLRLRDGRLVPGIGVDPEDVLYHQTQTERRDELGKSIMGRYAQAQIFATLYQAEVMKATIPGPRYGL